MVIIADKLDNISSIAYDVKRTGDEVWKRFNAGKEKQKWYYEGMLSAFQSRSIENEAYKDLLNELGNKVKEVFSTSGEQVNNSSALKNVETNS